MPGSHRTPDTVRRRRGRALWLAGVTASLVGLGSGCSGSMGGGADGAGGEGPGVSDPSRPGKPRVPGDPGTSDPGTPANPGAPGQPMAPGKTPPGAAAGACKATVPTRVTRLQDRHLANAIRDLLGLSRTPEIATGSGAKEEFLPNKAAGLNSTVARKLREIVETAALEATGLDKPAVKCAGDESACAGTFIEGFAGRAFRRPVTGEEKTKLLMTYASGREAYGGHAGGVRLVIEAVLQAPSFLYQTETGGTTGAGPARLTQFETAAKIAFFLRDSVPDANLWAAAMEGRLGTKEAIAAEVDKQLQLPEVKANISKMFSRLFQLDRMENISKEATVKEFTPALTASMIAETERFFDEVMWKGTGKLDELLTSRKTWVDANVAKIYGVKAPTASGLGEVTLPTGERAGVLTHPSLMTIEALTDDSSVVHRGVFLVREMLCFHPPPPTNDDLSQGDLIKKQAPTERERAERRAAVGRCAGCHASFDPLGVPFEHYDTLGRYRTTIKTANGDVPVNASWEVDVYDVKGPVKNAVELAAKLAASPSVRECMTRQFASYALGQRLTDEQACAVKDAAASFESSGGDFRQLVRAVAAWDGLRERQGGAP